MTKPKKIKFYDCFEMKTVLVDIDEVKTCFDEFKGVDYENIDDFMACHFISDKHRKYISGEVIQSKN